MYYSLLLICYKKFAFYVSSEAYGEIRFPLPDSKLNQKLSIQNLTQLLEICIRYIQVGKFS